MSPWIRAALAGVLGLVVALSSCSSSSPAGLTTHSTSEPNIQSTTRATINEEALSATSPTCPDVIAEAYFHTDGPGFPSASDVVPTFRVRRKGEPFIVTSETGAVYRWVRGDHTVVGVGYAVLRGDRWFPTRVHYCD